MSDITQQTAGQHLATAAYRVRRVASWPFRHRYAAPLWLALRLYLGWIWLQFGIDKLSSGWLASDPIGVLFRSIAKGMLPVPLAFYRDVAAMLLDLGVTPLISHAMPFLELAVALAFISGVLVGPAAVGAILLNVNIILSGIGIPAFDGQIIMLEMLLIMAWPIAGLIGIERLLGKALQVFKRLLRDESRRRSSRERRSA